MSSSIWTRCAGDSELRPLRLSPWRAVEAQHQVSTRKLVDTLEEQVLLEELIDRAKPPDVTRGRLHYLLATPFRYPPLRHGSRFGGRHERGIWYGSESRRTAFAEVAYYRLLFLEGTRAEIEPVSTQLTAFTVRVRTARGIDLASPPFDAFRRAIASPVRYEDAQALGQAMREAGVELFRYPSARDAEGGVNVGAFVPTVFGGARPRGLETWHCTATRVRVELAKRDYFARESFSFRREAFLVGGALPAPAL
jgi:RES domain-containing protein